MTSFPIPVFTLNMNLDSQHASGSPCPQLIRLCLLIGVPSAHVCLINRSGLNLISLLFKFLLDLIYASHICKNFNIFLLHFFHVGVCAFYFCLKLVPGKLILHTH